MYIVNTFSRDGYIVLKDGIPVVGDVSYTIGVAKKMALEYLSKEEITVFNLADKWMKYSQMADLKVVRAQRNILIFK